MQGGRPAAAAQQLQSFSDCDLQLQEWCRNRNSILPAPAASRPAMEAARSAPTIRRGGQQQGRRSGSSNRGSSMRCRSRGRQKFAEAAAVVAAAAADEDYFAAAASAEGYAVAACVWDPSDFLCQRS